MPIESERQIMTEFQLAWNNFFETPTDYVQRAENQLSLFAVEPILHMCLPNERSLKLWAWHGNRCSYTIFFFSYSISWKPLRFASWFPTLISCSPNLRVFTSGYVNTETILHFFNKIYFVRMEESHYKKEWRKIPRYKPWT